MREKKPKILMIDDDEQILFAMKAVFEYQGWESLSAQDVLDGLRLFRSEKPDLILIDGGRGQLNAALEAMRECGLSIPMFGLAKRVEEIVLPDEETSIFLDRHSEALHLIQRLRDEAHRFAITHHRSLRSSAALSSRLDAIPGIGPARKRALLTHFTTIQELLAADEKALCQVDGVSEKTAALIWRALHGEET